MIFISLALLMISSGLILMVYARKQQKAEMVTGAIGLWGAGILLLIAFVVFLFLDFNV